VTVHSTRRRPCLGLIASPRPPLQRSQAAAGPQRDWDRPLLCDQATAAGRAIVSASAAAITQATPAP
jgi:hypothetical protein